MYKSNIMRRALGMGAVVIALVFATAAFAQQPGRIRGQIEKADGSVLSLKQRDGTMLDVKVADDARVAALVKASLDDIKKDSFIGVAGMPRPDGSIEAFSVHIFLPAQRGVVADRHFNWDAKPGSTMTNAYVESTVAEKDGQSVVVKYKEGEKKIIVTPATAITAVAPGDKAELKPGTQIIIMAADKQPDGSVLAKTLYVGRSLTPAM
jgi:hypothetical protein